MYSESFKIRPERADADAFSLGDTADYAWTHVMLAVFIHVSQAL